jgi:hypothetical protein
MHLSLTLAAGLGTEAEGLQEQERQYAHLAQQLQQPGSSELD